MKSRSEDAAVDAFWRQWERSRPALERWIAAGGSGVDEKLEAEARRIGRALTIVNPGLRWEAGASDDSSFEFTVSPNRTPGLVEICQQVVRGAPRSHGWTFVSFRRRRELPKTVEIEREIGPVSVRIDNWQYSLTSFQGGEFFDVTLVAGSSAESVETADLEFAGVLCLEFALGEEALIRDIDRISVVREPGADADRLSSVQSLHKHIELLRSKRD